MRPELVAALRIEPGRGLVEKQNLRRMRRAARDLEPPAACRRRTSSTNDVAPVPQLEQLQQQLDALGARLARHVDTARRARSIFSCAVSSPSTLGSWKTMPKRAAHLERDLRADQARPCAPVPLDSFQQRRQHLNGRGLAGAVAGLKTRRSLRPLTEKRVVDRLARPYRSSVSPKTLLRPWRTSSMEFFPWRELATVGTGLIMHPSMTARCHVLAQSRSRRAARFDSSSTRKPSCSPGVRLEPFGLAILAAQTHRYSRQRRVHSPLRRERRLDRDAEPSWSRRRSTMSRLANRSSRSNGLRRRGAVLVLELADDTFRIDGAPAARAIRDSDVVVTQVAVAAAQGHAASQQRPAVDALPRGLERAPANAHRRLAATSLREATSPAIRHSGTRSGGSPGNMRREHRHGDDVRRARSRDRSASSAVSSSPGSKALEQRLRPPSARQHLDDFAAAEPRGNLVRGALSSPCCLTTLSTTRAPRACRPRARLTLRCLQSCARWRDPRRAHRTGMRSLSSLFTVWPFQSLAGGATESRHAGARPCGTPVPPGPQRGNCGRLVEMWRALELHF